MIAKVKVTENVWEFHDGARRINAQIHYPPPMPVGAVLAGNSVPAVGVREDVFDFTDRPCSEDEHKMGKVELWLYGKETGDIRQIIAYRPAYLLNDNGETVERI